MLAVDTTLLVRVKEALEDPGRLVLDLGADRKTWLTRTGADLQHPAGRIGSADAVSRTTSASVR